MKAIVRFLIPALLATALHAAPPRAELVSVKKIWDRAPHNGFTDLIRFHDQFFCCFREGLDHVGGDGVIRILSSRDGEAWEDCAGIAEPGVDLREPKLAITPDGRQLHLLCGGSIYAGGHELKGRRTRFATSSDGNVWTAPQPLLGEGDWLWRVALNPADKKSYGMADNIYPTTGGPTPEAEWSLKLYAGEGDQWQPLATLPVTGQPNQATLRFLHDGRALALVRRNTEDQGGIIGLAQPPYRDWQWTKTPTRISSPNFIELPGGALVAGARSYGKKPADNRLLLSTLTATSLDPLLELPSNGSDVGYPGLVFHDGLLWVSYNSSHEGKTSIYLAKVRLPAASATAKVEFNRDVRPILSDKCFKCHGPDARARKAKLRLDLRDDALADHENGPSIVPNHPEKSELLRRIETSDADDLMPPKKSNLHLSKNEMAILRQWIAEGAEYQPHWSLVPPKAAPLPAVKKADWPRNEIDHFILAKLEHENLTSSPEATKATLLRRATLTLTGLPPSQQELDAFLADPSPQSYEQAVNRLLNSPRFGERMALDWLDAARYADTNGYYNDSERQAWPWRDWVIHAFNANLPFDRFTVEQIAGDLLPNPTTDQKIATGFNRNHMVTNETGIIEEEYRTGYVMDRVDTTATVWMGLTLGCARCHDHKYDPLTQREYYQVFAAFNNIQETGLVKDVAPLSPAPTISLPTTEQDQRLATLGRERKECEANLKRFRPALDKEMTEWQKTALDSLPAAPTQGSLVHFNFDADTANHGVKPVSVAASGGFTFETGVKGKSVAFDATQYIEFTEPQPLERDQPFTFAVWIMPNAAPQGCVASKMDSDANGRGFEILWYKSQPRINLAHRYGHDGIEVVADQKFGGKQWHHLVITYDGSSKASGLKVYVDGSLNAVDVRRDNLSGSIATPEPWRIAWKGTGIGFDGGIDEVRLFDRALSSDEVSALHWREFIEGALSTPQRTRPQADKLEAYYIDHHGSDEVKRLSQQAATLRADEDAARKAILSASIMQEMEKPRDTHLLNRGQYDQPGDKVDFGVPASLGPLPKDAPRNRLGFAQWLVAPEHPLTARVEVNRLWQQCFGEGMVRTLNDFGLQGEAPSHPELLDWLAVRFRDGWDVKAMLKLIVTSATFRQASNFTPALLARDPDNHLLARGPRYRLPAEVIRDQALAVGGLLVERLGGPSVKPYQPPGLWEAVSYNGDATYVADTGESLYRRGLYTYWKRQAPPPGILTFDGPTREVCTVRRPRTNTPLQALVLLNDVTYVEAARGLATRMMQEPKERIPHGFRLATGRSPRSDETAALQTFCDEQLAVFRAKPESAKALLKAGESPAPALDPCELAAWTMTASLLLNLDETMTQH